MLGERYILIRLFRRADLPGLFGSDVFTRRTLRFAWHLTSVAWWMLLLAAFPAVDFRTAFFTVIATVFSASGVITLFASRGKHLAWMVFFAIAALSFAGA